MADQFFDHPNNGFRAVRLPPALTCPWWAIGNTDRGVREAIEDAFADFMTYKYEQYFISNRISGKRPQNYQQLAEDLSTSDRNSRNYKTGKTKQYPPAMLLGLATSFGIEPGSIFPTKVPWIAGTTFFLSNKSVQMEAAIVYAQYKVVMIDSDAIKAKRGFVLDDLFPDIHMSRVSEFLGREPHFLELPNEKIRDIVLNVSRDIDLKLRAVHRILEECRRFEDSCRRLGYEL